MKKTMAMLLAAALMAAALVGCGGGDSGGGGGETPAPAGPVGEVFDAGSINALVPEGWVAFPVMDIWADDPEATDPDAMQICKGGETEIDIFTHPYIQFNYYGPDTTMMTPGKEWYEEAEDIEPIAAGDYTWEGFVAISLEVPIACLWTDDGAGNEYQAMIILEGSEGKVTLEDADVLAILASVKPS